MMTKTQSKKVKQLKYLLLIPLLGSMVLYTACSGEEAKPEKQSVKQPVTVYVNKDGKIVERASSGYQSKYLDLYLGDGMPNAKEYSIDELREEEKGEYLDLLKGFNKEGMLQLNIRVFEAENGRKMVAFEKPNLSQYGKLGKINYHDSENVPFAMLDKAPTFPGCAEGDKDCFHKSVSKFVQDNFDMSITKDLGLSAGKKRIYVQFKIDKEGKVIDVRGRAPHPTLKQYAEELAQKLPQMEPGEQRGKKVRVGYTLPITFEVK